jgi:hypothetical protein
MARFIEDRLNRSLHDAARRASLEAPYGRVRFNRLAGAGDIPASEVNDATAALQETSSYLAISDVTRERARLTAQHAVGRRSTLSSLLLEVAQAFGDDVFDVNDIAQAISGGGALASKTHISTVLSRLVERNLIEAVSRGTGSTPSRYRNVKRGPASLDSDDVSSKGEERRHESIG